MTTNPRLDAIPTTANEGSYNGDNMSAVDSKGGACEDGEGDAVAGAGVAGEDEGEEEDEVGGEDGGDALHA